MKALHKKDGGEGGASLPSVPLIMPRKGLRMKAKLRSLGGFSLLVCRGPGDGGIESLDVALGDVDPHRDLPTP